MKKLRFFYIFFVISGAFSQEFNFVFEPEAFPVEIDGWQPFSPWAGGYSESAPDFCDIDADGDLDLFVGEYFGWVSFFENNGNMSTADFNLVERQYDSLLVFSTWCSNPDFFDIDNDSDFDTFIGSGHVTFVENLGSQYDPDFNSVRDTIFDISGEIVFGTHISVVDIDSDGDGDLICGEYQGHLQFYRNVGTPDSFAFYLEDDEWLGINVNGYADPTMIDIDSDNDYDLFIGDVDGNIHYYRNDGDSVNWNYTLISDNFLGIDVGDYASPEFADVDGDGDYDLFIGCDYSTGGSSRVGNVYYYENIGDSVEFQFEFVTKNYLCLDVGGNTIPQFVDINNDGKQDFFASSYYQLVYYQNTGSVPEPEFTFVEENFQGININGIHPWFVDIDADGDYDLLCGEAAIPGPPTLSLYINRGTAEEPDLFLYNEDFITNTDFHVNIQPGCADMDADGDQDLFISDDDGYFYFYRNDGDSANAIFTFVTDTWQEIHFIGGWRAFDFEDMDSDGDLDLLMTNSWYDDYDNLRYYKNTGDSLQVNMEFVTNLFLPGYEIYYAYPSVLDIDNDGDLDIFAGDTDGGIWFFRNLEFNSVSQQNSSGLHSFTLHQNYPNPFNASTTLTFNLSSSGRVSLKVYDITGREAASLVTGHLSLGQHSVVWNADDCASGVYLVRLTVEGMTDRNVCPTRKVVLVK